MISSSADDPHPPFRDEVRRTLRSAEDPRLPASLRSARRPSPSASCRLLDPRMRVVATYREHGQALARGVPADAIMAEMLGKREGCCRGRGGSMHLFDRQRRFYGGNAIVGGGLAAGDRRRARAIRRCRAHRAVTACFFGDGAVDEGEFHETLNLAALWKLPVLFVCENNLYAMGMAIERAEAETDIARKAAAYRLPSEQIDGMDVIAVEAAARRAVASIRERGGPFFSNARPIASARIRCSTRSSTAPKAEVEAWRAKGPIVRFRKWLEENRLHHRREHRRDGAGSRRGDRRGRRLRRGGNARAARRSRAFRHDGGGSAMSEPAVAPVRMTYREACKQASRRRCGPTRRRLPDGRGHRRDGRLDGRDPRACSTSSAPERVRNTPISEIARSSAPGSARRCRGCGRSSRSCTRTSSRSRWSRSSTRRPSNRYMSGGQLKVPVTIRTQGGAGWSPGAQHAQQSRGMVRAYPGPAHPHAGNHRGHADFMLIAALKDPNPVLIFEHVMLYNLEGDLSPGVGEVDISRAKVRRPGRDITLIAYGGSLFKTLEAAALLEKEGVNAKDFSDPACRYFEPARHRRHSRERRQNEKVRDRQRRLAKRIAVRRIGMRIAEEAFFELDAPPRRVCGREVPMPYAPIWRTPALPQPADIVAAARGLVRPACIPISRCRRWVPTWRSARLRRWNVKPGDHVKSSRRHHLRRRSAEGRDRRRGVPHTGTVAAHARFGPGARGCRWARCSRASRPAARPRRRSLRPRRLWRLFPSRRPRRSFVPPSSLRRRRSAPPTGRVKASPVARRRAAERRGVDLSRVIGTGLQGSIRLADVEGFRPAEAPRAAQGEIRRRRKCARRSPPR